MKAFKFIFSKFFPMALLMLLQLLVIQFAFALLNELVWVFQVVCDIVAMVVFLKVVNKRTNPEYKIPWIFLILAMPVFGLTMYALFANPKMKKSDEKKMRKILSRVETFTDVDEATRNETYAQMGCYEGVEKYLDNVTEFNGSRNNRVTYYKVGEEMWADMLIELNKAQHFIFMEYFIVDKGKMWDSIHEILVRKVAEGVEVRLMYDDIGTLTMQRHGYWRELRKEGIDCCKFASFRPVLSGIYNNRDHRKILVIDGKVGFTGGINIGDEYINENHRLGHWKDTGVKIEGRAVYNLTALFLTTFDLTAKEDSAYDMYFPADIPVFADGGVTHVFGDGPRPYYAEQVAESNFVNMITSAHNYVWITTPYLIVDYNLASALRNAAMRGVDVRIVTPHIPDKRLIFDVTRSNYRSLMNAGVKIYEYTPGFIHAKTMVVDGVMAFVGTVNMDYRSLTHHFEDGVVLFRTPCIDDIVADLTNVFEVSEFIDPETFKMGKVESFFAAILQLIAPML